MRMYVSSSWNTQAHNQVVDALVSLGHEVYNYRKPPLENDVEVKPFGWPDVDRNFQKWTPTLYRSNLDNKLVVEGFNRNLAAMKWAEACVLLLPSNRNAHLEAGYFLGAGKKLHVLVTQYEEPELMHKMATNVFVSINEMVSKLKYMW